VTRKRANSWQYKPMSRTDIVLRSVVVAIMLSVAIYFPIAGGLQDLLLLFGVLVGAMALSAILSFVGYGAPFTILGALLLAPLIVSWFVPNFVEVLESWFIGSLAGAIVGAMLRSDWDRRRGRSAPVPSGSRGIVGDSLEWRVGRKAFQEDEFSESALLAKIQSLDGERRPAVTATRRGARLGVVGDAQGAVVVYFCPAGAVEDQWSLLTSPGSEPGQIEMRVGHTVTSYASWETTTLEKALVAARYFHRRGRADPEMPWSTSPMTIDWRALCA
jgi:hypothetical protein